MKQNGIKNPTKACPIIIKARLFGKCNKADGPTKKIEKPDKAQLMSIINLFSINFGRN